MKTTALIIEFLVGGMLFLFSIFFLAYCLDTQTIDNLYEFFQNYKKYAILITMLVTALSYALGIIVEPIARIIFENLMQIFICKKRFIKYITKHQKNIKHSPILKRYELKKLENIKSFQKFKSYLSAMGEMRFYVLMNSERLYSEIESQLNRLRLIRVLVLVEIVLLISLILKVVTNASTLLYFLILAVFIILILNILAISVRYDRYYRAVERAYEALVFDQYGALPNKENAKNSH
jgi:hypothetical protein